MSIRSAMVVLGVCAGFSAQAAPVFTPGDVFWVSRKPMAMYEVSGGSSTTLTTHSVFPTNWNSLGTLTFADDGSAGYLTVSDANQVVRLNPDGTYSNALSHASPSGLAFLDNTMYVTSSTAGTLSKVVNGTATQVLAGLEIPRAMIAYEGGLLISEQGSLKGKLRKVTFNGGNATSTYYSGINRPIDMAIFGGSLYYTDLVKMTATETITKVIQMDLVTGAKTDHAWGQRFWGLTVANGRLLAGNYKEATSGIWDITTRRDYTQVAPWASGLPGASELMLATVPGTLPPPADPGTDPDPDTQTPPAETPEPSTLLLMASGLLMMSVRATRRPV